MKIIQVNYCISVVGPTATGKTKKALQLANLQLKSGLYTGVDLISADSRQVYRGLEVLTGADVPKGFEGVMLRQAQHDTSLSVTLRRHPEFIEGSSKSDLPYFTNADDSIHLFGISMIDPAEEWSLAHFVNFAREIMVRSWSNGRLPIVVGGTGLYHRHLFSDDETPQIPQNLTIRSKAENMLVEDLQQWLSELNSSRLDQMNESDRENPRRLIRAIEVATWQKQNRDGSLIESKSSESPIMWSRVNNQIELLSLPLAELQARIDERVKSRFASGAVQEVQNLLKTNLPKSALVLTTLGVPEISIFLNGKISAEDCQKLWSLHEFQYAKRQLTWWKKIYTREKMNQV